MIKNLILFVLVCTLVFIMMEGVFSCLVVAYKVLKPSREPATLPTQYDKELGWMPVPNFFKKDFYAPGIDLRINSQGFRNNQDFSVNIPAGRLRVICSGDSFTIGVGVDNDSTWCQQMESLDDRLEMVNLGQGGYGVDQMFLRYRRESDVLEHDAHIFAFINEDFRRMQLKAFSGRAKPILKVQNSELIEDNVPVPRSGPASRRLTLNVPEILQLRSLMVLGQIFQRVSPKPDAENEVGGGSLEQRQTVIKIIEALQAIGKQKNNIQIWAYIPSRSEYNRNNALLEWRKFIQEETQKRGVFFVDLLDDYQKFTVNELDSLYIHRDAGQYYDWVAGHMNEAGNKFVAKEIYNKLSSIPEISRKLASLTALHTQNQKAAGPPKSIAK